MGLCSCNSAGHLSNHVDIAPNHAGTTFAISNTIVSTRRIKTAVFTCLYISGDDSRDFMRADYSRDRHVGKREVVPRFSGGCVR